MGFITEELDASLARIEWKLNVKCPGSKEKHFRLEYHPSIAFSIGCILENGENDSDPAQWVGLGLEFGLIENLTKNANGSEKDCYQDSQPSTIFASFNGGKRFLLRNVNHENLLASEKLKVPNDRYPHKPLLVWTIWIKFDVLSPGELKILKNLTDAYVQQTGCDVRFLMENGQQIGGHIALLSAMSPVFAAMFQHNTKEAQTRKVHIEDVPIDIFKQLLHYLYAGRLAGPLNEETAKQLFEAADKYNIPQLMDKCVEYLLPRIQLGNALFLIVWADLHSIKNLKEAVLSFICQNSQEICLRKDWEEFLRNYPDLCVIVTREMMKQLSVK